MTDFYEDSARQRLAQLEADKSQELANLAQHKANGDLQSAAETVQCVANIEAQKNNLLALHRQYADSLNPPAPPPLSREEQQAKPWNKMDYGDALELAKTSKYGKALSHDDPAIQAGYREVAKRRSRGE
jgi:hypothetical protein